MNQTPLDAVGKTIPESSDFFADGAIADPMQKLCVICSSQIVHTFSAISPTDGLAHTLLPRLDNERSSVFVE